MQNGKAPYQTHNALLLCDLPCKYDPCYTVLLLRFCPVEYLAVISHPHRLDLLWIRMIDRKHAFPLGFLRHKDPVELTDLSCYIFPLKLRLRHLPQIRVMAEAIDRILREMLPHNGRQQIEMMA